MLEYQIIFQILTETISGQNLKNAFEKYTTTADKLNIAKIKDISYGVCRYYFRINAILNKLCKNKPSSDISIILTIGIYELEYSKKPAYAIVNELVNLTANLTHNNHLKNFVNAVMRNFLRNIDNIKLKLKSSLEYRYNFPNQLLNKIKDNYPQNWQQILSNADEQAKLCLRVNLRKISIEQYCEILNEANLSYTIYDNVVVLDHNNIIADIPYFNQGYVSIQDIHAQKLKEIVTISDNQYVLDACAAPGGKTCQILENYCVNLLSIDIDNRRIDKIRQNLNRLCLKATVKCADASLLDWWDGEEFDVIIADVPCSASGTIRRNPDIKLHYQTLDINNLCLKQRSIVLNLWQTLKLGGILVYITCSIMAEENQDNIKYLTANINNLQIIKEVNLPLTRLGDGFYYCVLKKIKPQ